jgi:hypothetical protein
MDLITRNVVKPQSRRERSVHAPGDDLSSAKIGPKGMKASDKYINVFGRLESLADRIPWTTGVSNMLEWLTWMTGNVLGITKTKYAERIIDLTQEHAVRDGTHEEILNYVRQRLDEERSVANNRSGMRLPVPPSRLQGKLFVGQSSFQRIISTKSSIFFGSSSAINISMHFTVNSRISMAAANGPRTATVAYSCAVPT